MTVIVRYVVPRTADARALRPFVRVSPADRPRVLDAGALLDRRRPRWRLSLAAAASVDRARVLGAPCCGCSSRGGATCASRPRIAPGGERCAHYMRNEDAQVPPAGRFNFGQKQLFWLMVVGGRRAPALRASCSGSWPRFRGSSGACATRAVLVHAVAALATIGGFIIHLYMGLAVVPGGSRGHPARRGHRGMGAAASPAVAGADPFRGSRRNGRFEAGKYRRTIRTRRHRTGSCPSA